MLRVFVFIFLYGFNHSYRWSKPIFNSLGSLLRKTHGFSSLFFFSLWWKKTTVKGKAYHFNFRVSLRKKQLRISSTVSRCPGGHQCPEVRPLEAAGAPHWGSRTWPIPPAQLESRESHRAAGAAPALSTGRCPGNWGDLKVGWNMGPWVGPAWLDPWLGQAVRSWRLALLWCHWDRD